MDRPGRCIGPSKDLGASGDSLSSKVLTQRHDIDLVEGKQNVKVNFASGIEVYMRIQRSPLARA